MEKLNTLQRTVEDRIKKVIDQAGRTLEERGVFEAEVPFYSDEPFWFLKLKSQDLELWIYDDECSFSSQSGGGGLELADYENEAEYVDAIAEQIREVL